MADDRKGSEPLDPGTFWRKFLKVLKRGEGELTRILTGIDPGS
jgi:hypothetical protein